MNHVKSLEIFSVFSDHMNVATTRCATNGTKTISNQLLVCWIKKVFRYCAFSHKGKSSWVIQILLLLLNAEYTWNKVFNVFLQCKVSAFVTSETSDIHKMITWHAQRFTNGDKWELNAQQTTLWNKPWNSRKFHVYKSQPFPETCIQVLKVHIWANVWLPDCRRMKQTVFRDSFVRGTWNFAEASCWLRLFVSIFPQNMVAIEKKYSQATPSLFIFLN